MYQSLSYYVILKRRNAPSNASDLASDRASDLASVLASDLVSDFSDRMDILWEDVAASFSPHSKVVNEVSKGADSQHVCSRFQTQYVIGWDMLNLLQLFYRCQNLRHGLGTAAKCCFRACGKTRLRPCSDHLWSTTIYEVLGKNMKKYSSHGFGSGFVLSKSRWQTFFEKSPALSSPDRCFDQINISWRSCGCKGLPVTGCLHPWPVWFWTHHSHLGWVFKDGHRTKNHGWNLRHP